MFSLWTTFVLKLWPQTHSFYLRFVSSWDKSETENPGARLLKLHTKVYSYPSTGAQKAFVSQTETSHHLSDP